MAKKKSCCPPPKEGIPSWFMTYSDVITLLMTFFILLLTFATNEPEFFSKVKIVSFGGGGGSGMASESDNVLDKDGLVVRERPNSAAITTRGTETPPVNEAPVKESVSRGLKSLEQPDALADAQRVRIKTKLNLIQGNDGQITEQGVTQLQMLAQQLRNQPLSLTINASDSSAVDFCVTMARILAEEFQVIPGRIAIAFTDVTKVPDGELHYLLSHSSER